MAKEKFEDRRLTGAVNVACKFDDGSVRMWSDRKENIVENIIRIVLKYRAEGYTLTLRQLHYQFVGHDSLYVNHDSAYKKLGNILDDCRYAGLIDWDAIEDRGRVPYMEYSVDDIEDALDDTIAGYKLNRQDGQDTIVELWTEKDALSGILKRPAEQYHVRLCVNKGYSSSSAFYRTYKRVSKIIKEGKKFIILYFGDHDPSGLDMVRDIRERITLFLTQGKLTNGEFFEKVTAWWEKNNFNVYDLEEGEYITSKERMLIMKDETDSDKANEIFERGQMKMYFALNDSFQVIPIGLTKAQIKQYRLPPNPTKMTDSRADEYVKDHGKTCWEVDALEPQVLTEIVEKNIEAHIDVDLYNQTIAREEKEKVKIAKLKNFIDQINDDEE